MKHLARTFISTKILWDTKESPIQHGTEHTQSVRLKAVPQSDFNGRTCVLKIREFQVEQEKSHTHTHTHINTHTYTHTQSADIQLVI
jgi:hypothetical protein